MTSGTANSTSSGTHSKRNNKRLIILSNNLTDTKKGSKKDVNFWIIGTFLEIGEHASYPPVIDSEQPNNQTTKNEIERTCYYII